MEFINLIVSNFGSPLTYPNLLISIILILAVYYDRKNKEVPDLLTASLWLVSLLLSKNLFELVLSFTVLYLINTLAVTFSNKVLLGWADILGMPPFIISLLSLSTLFKYAWVFGVASLFLFLMISTYKKARYLKEKNQQTTDQVIHEIPLFPYLAAGQFMAFLTVLFLG